jgi:mannitol/fructose-specific phosphotransferase system IIA component (Ntr-type)
MPMKLTSYVRPDCFVHALAAKTREEALRGMVRVIAEKGIIKDQATILERLLERERIQSTAVGSGIAIPHCFTDEVADLVIVVARAPDGIAFDSFDGRPTHVVFLLLGNRQEHSLHLKALARIARLIKSTAFIDRVIAADSVDAMVRAFEEEEARI